MIEPARLGLPLACSVLPIARKLLSGL